MWNLFWHKSVCPIALDIGSASVRMLQLKASGTQLKVLAGAWQRFSSVPRGADDAQSPERRALAVQTVREMLRRGGFRGRSVISCLPTKFLSIKNVRVSARNDEELRRVVFMEAKERFTFPIREDCFTFLRAGQVRQGSEVREEVLMMAAPPKAVEDHLEMLDAMGLRLEHLDAEPMAMFRSFERYLRRIDDEQQVCVMVDIGLLGTRVVVSRGRQIVFIKWIEIGGRNLNEAVAKQLNLSYEEAAELRVRIVHERSGNVVEGGRDATSEAGRSPADSAKTMTWTLRDAIRGEVEALARELSLCLRYCSVTFRGLRPQQVTVTGGEAYDVNVVELLSENLGLACQVGQPLRGVDTSAVDLGADRRGALTEWTICTGLAIRDLDMAPLQRGMDVDVDRRTA